MEFCYGRKVYKSNTTVSVCSLFNKEVDGENKIIFSRNINFFERSFLNEKFLLLKWWRSMARVFFFLCFQTTLAVWCIEKLREQNWINFWKKKKNIAKVQSHSKHFVVSSEKGHIKPWNGIAWVPLEPKWKTFFKVYLRLKY